MIASPKEIKDGLFLVIDGMQCSWKENQYKYKCKKLEHNKSVGLAIEDDGYAEIVPHGVIGPPVVRDEIMEETFQQQDIVGVWIHLNGGSTKENAHLTN